jgi:hypothetical protein
MTARRSLPRTRETAVAIAGALAEYGVQRITFRAPGREPQELHARTTDLPALLLESVVGAEFHVFPSFVITTADHELIAQWQHDQIDSATIVSALDLTA